MSAVCPPLLERVVEEHEHGPSLDLDLDLLERVVEEHEHGHDDEQHGDEADPVQRPIPDHARMGQEREAVSEV